MNIEYEKQAGQKLREMRIKYGFTQEQRSAQLQIHGCDITRSALAKIEAGQRHLYIDELKLVVKILKCEYQDILP